MRHASPRQTASTKSRAAANRKRQATELSAGTDPSWYRMTCQVEAQISVGPQNSRRRESMERLGKAMAGDRGTALTGGQARKAATHRKVLRISAM
jgi:hypothetical protein